MLVVASQRTQCQGPNPQRLGRLTRLRNWLLSPITNRLHARPFESLFEIGSRKSAPVPLVTTRSPACTPEAGTNSEAIAAADSLDHRESDRKNLQHVGEIHSNVDDRRTVLSKCRCKRRCFATTEDAG